MVGWLRHWGVTTQEAGSGQEALELARLGQPGHADFDLFLFDADLPGMDGLELATQLTQEGLAGQGRVIMISSGGNQARLTAAKGLELLASLTKPATHLELRETLTRLLDPGVSRQLDAAPDRSGTNVQRHRDNGLRILLVEDNLINQKLARALLEQWGHEVTLAENGQIALELFRPAAFDLVLMDMQMPIMDGIEATRRIRAKEQGTTRTPIVAMTANAMASDRALCFEAGMDEHLPKPLRPKLLEEMIQRFTEARPR